MSRHFFQQIPRVGCANHLRRDYVSQNNMYDNDGLSSYNNYLGSTAVYLP